MIDNFFGPNDPIVPPPEPPVGVGEAPLTCEQCCKIKPASAFATLLQAKPDAPVICDACLDALPMDLVMALNKLNAARPVAALSGATEDKIDAPVEPSAPSFGLGDRPAVAPKREAFTRAPDRDHNGSHAWQHADHTFLTVPKALPVSCPVCEGWGTLTMLLKAALDEWKDGARPTPYDAELAALARALEPEPRRTLPLICGESLAYEYAKAPGPFLARFDALAAPRQAAITQAFAAFLGCDVSVVDELWVESRMRLAAF